MIVQAKLCKCYWIIYGNVGRHLCILVLCLNTEVKFPTHESRMKRIKKNPHNPCILAHLWLHILCEYGTSGCCITAVSQNNYLTPKASREVIPHCASNFFSSIFPYFLLIRPTRSCMCSKVGEKTHSKSESQKFKNVQLQKNQRCSI